MPKFYSRGLTLGEICYVLPKIHEINFKSQGLLKSEITSHRALYSVKSCMSLQATREYVSTYELLTTSSSEQHFRKCAAITFIV